MLNTYVFLGLCLSILCYAKGVYGSVDTNRDKVFLATALVLTTFGWLPLLAVAYCRRAGLTLDKLVEMAQARLGA